MTSKEALEILKDSYHTKRDTELLESIQKDLDKLEQLAKIEEELGIDLITLFKALQNGVYVKRKNKYIYIDCADLSLNNKRYSNEYEAIQNDTTIYEGYNLALLGNKEWLYFNDYGKTWSLTEKELRK